MNTIFTYDATVYMVDNGHGDIASRFRNPKTWFSELADPFNKLTKCSLQELETIPTDKFVIHEIHTERGPFQWLGGNAPETPDIISLIPEWLVDKVRSKTAILYIDQACEGFPLNGYLGDFYIKIHQLLNDYNLPPSQIIYSTGNLIENEVYTKWCNAHNITDPMLIVGVNLFADICANGYIFSTDSNEISCEEHLSYKSKNDIKVFNNLNRVIREHRVAMTSMLNYYQLIEDNLVSQAAFPNHYKEQFSPYNKCFNPHPAFETSNMLDVNSKLPMVLDTDQFEINKADHFFKQVYLDSWISVITETYYVESTTDTVFLSEKIYKPIRARHPFIMVGQYNSLAVLKKEGFKTFSEFWDESYDDIEDNTERMEAICLLLKDLSKLSKPEWLRLYLKMQPILEHNMRHLTYNNWLKPMQTLINSHGVLKELS